MQAIFCVGLLLLIAADACAQKPEKTLMPKHSQANSLTLDRIYKKNEFQSKSYGVSWFGAEGDDYVRFEKAEDGKGKDLVRVTCESNEKEILVPASDFIPKGKKKPLGVQSYQWSEDKSSLLIFTNTRRVWRTNSRGDYWVLDRNKKTLKQLGSNFPESTLMFAKFSPDGKSVAYVHERDIYVESLADQNVSRLTEKSSDSIINGTFDWVYEEEFALRDGFRWSPDGKKIAFWQLDTSDVPQFTMINNTATLYPELKIFGYPKVGQTNPACQVGIVNVADKETVFIDLPGDKRNNYVPKMEWTKSSDKIVLQQLNRLQNELKIWTANATTGNPDLLFTDKDGAWIDVDEDLKWLDDGKAFTWSSEKDGWNRLYRIDIETGKESALTPEGMDVIDLLSVSEDGETCYFIASPEDATQRYLYRSNGNGKSTRVTPDVPGSHRYDISPKLNWAVHRFSAMNKPPVYELVRLPDHQTVRVFENNSALVEKLEKEKLGKTSFQQIDIGEAQLDSWQILPPDFDETKKYPLLIYVYGEPAGQTVRDRWGGSGFLWHQMLAQQGYVVMSFDNRGTPAPRGREWRKSIYRKIGVLSSADQARAIKSVLKQFSYIDPERVGIWGWSGGGSMSLNAIFRYPELYKMAVSIAPVPNQRYYDTIYQERYMGLPDGEGAEFYKQGSPITFAHQLKGKLLLIHGTGDDNCHYQTMELLINELIKHNKQFSMMAYPNRGHGISEGKNTTRHLRQLMTDFILENL